MLLWLSCPPPELPPPIGIGIPPLLPDELPDIPPGIPGVLMGIFSPEPLTPGMSMLPRGGRPDSSKTETPPPIGMPPVEIEGPRLPLLLLALFIPAPFDSASKIFGSGSNWAWAQSPMSPAAPISKRSVREVIFVFMAFCG